ncbi:MAG TPA: TIGR01777 family oxidoreductase [Jatrophihabitans sp.]|nr:TIGR01777 family oxidoreductase [Jatrophihabitans sp.]
MKVLIAGASGFLGRALSQELVAHGHDVHALVRRPARAANEIEWHPEHADLDPDALRGFGAVIGLSGAGIADRRWTSDYKRQLVDSRVQPTATLANALAALPQAQRPRTFLSASAVGYYGDRGEELLPESASFGSGFLADLVRRWEAATQPAVAAGLRVVTLRTGLVLAAGGGLLGRLVPLFRLGLGGKLGTGRQYQPWISLADEVGAIRFVLESGRISGAVNLSGPTPVRNSEFTAELGRVLHRPAVLPVPAFALRLALGEFADEGALVSQRVTPERLIEAGYEFQHNDLRAALDWAVVH